jgi:hypothetical protein
VSGHQISKEWFMSRNNDVRNATSKYIHHQQNHYEIIFQKYK